MSEFYVFIHKCMILDRHVMVCLKSFFHTEKTFQCNVVSIYYVSRSFFLTEDVHDTVRLHLVLLFPYTVAHNTIRMAKANSFLNVFQFPEF